MSSVPLLPAKIERHFRGLSPAYHELLNDLVSYLVSCTKGEPPKKWNRIRRYDWDEIQKKYEEAKLQGGEEGK